MYANFLSKKFNGFVSYAGESSKGLKGFEMYPRRVQVQAVFELDNEIFSIPFVIILISFLQDDSKSNI